MTTWSVLYNDGVFQDVYHQHLNPLDLTTFATRLPELNRKLLQNPNLCEGEFLPFVSTDVIRGIEFDRFLALFVRRIDAYRLRWLRRWLNLPTYRGVIEVTWMTILPARINEPEVPPLS